MGQRYPLPITAAMVTPANQNADKPSYAAMTGWAGGVKGDDVDVATATVALARSDGGANEADYTPRTQAAKATALGTTLAVDVTRARGWLEPDDPYAAAPATPAGDPVVSSISPTTAAATAMPVVVTITGLRFTPWSTVHTGGQDTPDLTGQYISATKMRVVIYNATPGTVSIAVKDHDALSNVDKVFTVT